MTPDDFYVSELSRLQAEAGSGNYLAVVEAFLLLAWRAPAFPAWLVEAIETSLLHTYNTGGTGGHGGRGGTHQVQASLYQMHIWRWAKARRYLDSRAELSVQLGRRATREDAFRAAADDLAKFYPRVGWETVEKSFKDVERIRRGMK